MKLDLDGSAEIGARVLVLIGLDDAADAAGRFGNGEAFEEFERAVARTCGTLRIWRRYLPQKSRKGRKKLERLNRSLTEQYDYGVIRHQFERARRDLEKRLRRITIDLRAEEVEPTFAEALAFEALERFGRLRAAGEQISDEGSLETARVLAARLSDAVGAIEGEAIADRIVARARKLQELQAPGEWSMALVDLGADVERFSQKLRDRSIDASNGSHGQ